jgi:hypothetical protein
MLCSSCVFRFGLILHKKGMHRYKMHPISGHVFLFFVCGYYSTMLKKLLISC